MICPSNPSLSSWAARHKLVLLDGKVPGRYDRTLSHEVEASVGADSTPMGGEDGGVQTSGFLLPKCLNITCVVAHLGNIQHRLHNRTMVQLPQNDNPTRPAIQKCEVQVAARLYQAVPLQLVEQSKCPARTS